MTETNGHPKAVAEKRRDGLRFTHLRLENWKNFRAVDVDVERRTFVVGPNASGKSNFLDAFRFLYDLARSGGGFQSAVERRISVSAIRSLSARRYPEVGIEATIGTDDRPSTWTYKLRFEQNNNRVPLITHESAFFGDALVFERPVKDDREDPQRLTQTYLEQVQANKTFRDISDFFETVRYLHVVPQLIREPDRSVGKKERPFRRRPARANSTNAQEYLTWSTRTNSQGTESCDPATSVLRLKFVHNIFGCVRR